MIFWNQNLFEESQFFEILKLSLPGKPKLQKNLKPALRNRAFHMKLKIFQKAKSPYREDQNQNQRQGEAKFVKKKSMQNRE